MFPKILENMETSVYLNENFYEKILVLSDVHTSLNSVRNDRIGALLLDEYQIERLGSFLTVLEPYLENPADIEVCKGMISSLSHLYTIVDSLEITKS